MKKQLLMLGMIFLPAMAMAAPDFNGTWALDKTASDRAPNDMYWLTRSGPTMGGGRGNAEVLMTVQQNGKTLQVSDSQHPMREYAVDGSSHTRATDTGIQKATVNANWQGDNLVIDTTEPYGGMPGNAILKVKEVWSLSPDGKTLTITTSRDVPAKQQTYKEVYTRTQANGAELCSAGCVAPAPR